MTKGDFLAVTVFHIHCAINPSHAREPAFVSQRSQHGRARLM